LSARRFGDHPQHAFEAVLVERRRPAFAPSTAFGGPPPRFRGGGTVLLWKGPAVQGEL
jgi:hypothetical protein